MLGWRGRSTTAAGAVAAVLVAGLHASSAFGLTITTDQGLQPAPDPAVHDYVTRCEPGNNVRVSVADTGFTGVSVDGDPERTGTFQTTVALQPGQRFVVRIAGSDYNVRCLPADFPRFTVRRDGRPQAAYYVTTPGLTIDPSKPIAPYVALFDDDGVPVWWYRPPTGTPTDANVLPDGTVTWNLEENTTGPFGGDYADRVVERRLDGSLVREARTWWWPTDFHESLTTSDGNLLMTTYQPRDVSGLFGLPWGISVLDAGFQEINPAGWPVYQWSSVGHLQRDESLRWWYSLFAYPGRSGLVWDWQHINSVEPDGDGFLVSMRHTDAIYRIRRSDGGIDWKLGGTTTPQSLRVVGDPRAPDVFGGQHDARVLPDGTVSVHDNGTGRGRPPRIVRYRIDAGAGTATLVQEITDPDPGAASPCCGSARMLPGGDWVAAWGGTSSVQELRPDGSPVLELRFAAPYFTYRAPPVPPGRLDRSEIVAAMDATHPRP